MKRSFTRKVLRHKIIPRTVYETEIFYNQLSYFAVCSVAASVVPFKYLHDCPLWADQSLSRDTMINAIQIEVLPDNYDLG